MPASESPSGSKSPPGSSSESADLDRHAIAELARQRVGWADKSMPPEIWGRTVAEVVALRIRLSRFPTPLLTLSAPAMRHNLETISAWCADRGLDLAPHGKTTMAPQLWADQLQAGAWAITLANLPQLAVARGFGVSRILVANEIISPLTLRWIADELAADPAAEVICWSDASPTVALMEEALAAHAPMLGDAFRPLDVLVEVGGAGGRTGARDVDEAVEIGRAVAAAPHLRLAGVGGYEGALSHWTDADSLAGLRTYLETLVVVHHRLAGEGRYPADGRRPVLTAGGSTYFDVVADVLGPLVEEGVRVVLRSGAYVAHDDGLYRQLSALGEHPRTSGPTLRSALHGWARVASQPGARAGAARRRQARLPYDEGLPTVQLAAAAPGGRRSSSRASSVTALERPARLPARRSATTARLQVGDVLRLGLSHPCTAFDKWTLIPVVDDARSADPNVVDLVRTFF